jgi:hypothetical protein
VKQIPKALNLRERRSIGARAESAAATASRIGPVRASRLAAPRPNMRPRRRDDAVRRNILAHDHVRADQNVIADRHRADDDGARAELDAIADPGIPVLVASGAERADGHILADMAIVPDADLGADHDPALMRNPQPTSDLHRMWNIYSMKASDKTEQYTIYFPNYFFSNTAS